MNWKCPVCGNEDNPVDSMRCICGNEVTENSKYAVKEKLLDDEPSEPLMPPSTCPKCGHWKFKKLEPEEGTEHTVATLIGFILDFIKPAPIRSIGLEISNRGRPGWLCEKCRYEIRVKRQKV